MNMTGVMNEKNLDGQYLAGKHFYRAGSGPGTPTGRAARSYRGVSHAW